MTQPTVLLKIAVPGPFRKLFDYLPLETNEKQALLPGIRVLVPFGPRKVIGILIEITNNNQAASFKLRTVTQYLDAAPLFDEKTFSWLRRVSQYYHHPLGETLLTAIPTLLRKEKKPHAAQQVFWQALSNDPQQENTLQRAPKQRAVYQFIQQQNSAVSQKVLLENFLKPQSILKTLQAKNLIKPSYHAKDLPAANLPTASPGQTLTDAQQAVTEAMLSHIHEFKVMLLNGVTGSGKTEVYITVAKKVVASGKQVLILLPEIALTPQLVARFRCRFTCMIDVLHSGLNDTERFTVWDNIKNNRTQILIGTRSAIFSPFESLGLIVIDEEHDLSFKQQDGLRYSTRDIAILRAKPNGFPVILGSATPSLESIANIEKPHYLQLHLTQRAGKAMPPKIKTLDIRGRKLIEGLANDLITQMTATLERDEQVLLFLNQRGYAPALICHQCGVVEKCPRCDRNMTIHQARNRITCHHCGYEKKLPNECIHCKHSDLRPIGYGTERIEKCLQTLFPDTDIIRIDRDTTARKNAILRLLEKVKNDTGQILLGTQMLAKGHDFPNVTLVGILNADQGLFGADMRSGERLAQLITQVAGRAGRGNKPGYVLIQTHNPEHALWHTLIHESYNTYAQQALEERRQAGLPPYSFAGLFRAESTDITDAIQFLNAVKKSMQTYEALGVEIYGPVSAPMERRAGKFRIQLLLISQQRDKIHQCIAAGLNEIENLKLAKKVRWNLDVDPLDMS